MADQQQPGTQGALARDAFGFDPNLFIPQLGQLSANTSTFTRPQNTAKLLRNFHFINGTWTTIATGWTKHRTVKPAGAPAEAQANGRFNSGGVFLDFGVHFLGDGTNKFLMQCGTKVYSYNPLTDGTTEVEVARFTATNGTSIPCMRSFSPGVFVYCNGIDEPQKWDGSAGTFSALQRTTATQAAGNWPATVSTVSYSKPQLCEPFLGRMAFAKFLGATNQRFDVLISQFGNTELFDDTGVGATRAGVFKVPSTLGPITSLRALKLSNQTNDEVLLVGCSKGIAVITGTDANSFQLRVLTRNFGVLTNRGWIQLNNDLYFLATDGIRRFSALVNNANLLNATLTFGLQDVIIRQNTAQLEQAFAFHNPKTLEVIFWFALDALSHNQDGIIMNYGAVQESYEQLTPIFSVKKTPTEDSGDATTFRSPSCGIEYEGHIYCGGYNGFLQDYYSGNKYDTEIIGFQYNSALVRAGTPAQTSDVRQFQVIVDGGTQEFTVNIYGYEVRRAGELARRLMSSQLVIINGGGGTVLTTGSAGWQLGTDSFPVNQLQLVEVLSKGTARFWDMEIIGNSSNAMINFVGFFSLLIKGGTRQ